MADMPPKPVPLAREFRSARVLALLPVSDRTLWLWRLATDRRPAIRSARHLRIHNRSIASSYDGAAIRLRTYCPRNSSVPTPALIWLHGGGYVMGRPEMDDRWCIRCARSLGITVVSVDYRRAPEHPFPAPLEDAYAALLWMHSHGDDLGIDPGRIAVGGASAGGGLAAALAQLAHDREQCRPACQLLVYPMLDDRTTCPPDLSAVTLAWTPDSNRYGWDAYLRSGEQSIAPPDHAVPARREDLSGLPPAWIGVGACDLFRDESLAYAHRLRQAGVRAKACIVPGAPHAFDVVAPRAPSTRAFRRAQFDFLVEHLFPTDPDGLSP